MGNDSKAFRRLRKSTGKGRMLQARDSRSRSKASGSIEYVKRKHSGSILLKKDKSEYGHNMQL